MTSSKYQLVKDFNEHVLQLPDRISSVGISSLIFQDGLHPNDYTLRYFLRNKATGQELTPQRITIKLNPMLPTRTNVALLENIPVGIGYDLVLQFGTLESPKKPTRIAVQVEYQVYL